MRPGTFIAFAVLSALGCHRDKKIDAPPVETTSASSFAQVAQPAIQAAPSATVPPPASAPLPPLPPIVLNIVREAPAAIPAAPTDTNVAAPTAVAVTPRTQAPAAANGTGQYRSIFGARSAPSDDTVAAADVAPPANPANVAQNAPVAAPSAAVVAPNPAMPAGYANSGQGSYTGVGGGGPGYTGIGAGDGFTGVTGGAGYTGVGAGDGYTGTGAGGMSMDVDTSEDPTK